jgi:hypothetical protein
MIIPEIDWNRVHDLLICPMFQAIFGLVALPFLIRLIWLLHHRK